MKTFALVIKMSAEPVASLIQPNYFLSKETLANEKYRVRLATIFLPSWLVFNMNLCMSHGDQGG